MSQIQQYKTWKDFVADAKTRIHEVSQEEFRQWQAAGKEMVVLDVRESNDHAHSRIENSLNVPRGVLELEIEDAVPDRRKIVVAYCGGGGRSAMAADVLQQMGYEQVYSLQGGYKQWKEKPYPALDYDNNR